MTLGEVCDFVYTLILDRAERYVLAERQVAVLAAALSVTVDPLDTEDISSQLDAALNAEPEKVDPEKLELLRALGVR